ncbi:dihydrolipoyl dehydrogenase [Provencibacterium massiliense]|uniref:dihydrolipoyl dehydrogenase n=1 Tax=Provencibacterium massiliense TaxID=1841868 RepID=UPI0009A8B8D4|nr:dihydrolipoyl dehydrogenase [Provencibacterium massiliense]RGB67256.1 dihydrolipoyl dehydrogenase [Harryflintia acetispora]
MSEQFDLVIVGAGPGGYEAAIRASQLGMKTALIERGEVGGTCLNRGCIPTKALLHAAESWRALQHFPELGLSVEGAGFDYQKVSAYKNGMVERLRAGVEGLIHANGITLVHGGALITGPHQVAVSGGEERRLTGKRILIAAGSLPAVPPIGGADLPGVMDSDMLLSCERLPQSLCLIGGGVIGVEFSTVLSSFGCKVTILEAAPRLLPGMDREISQNLAMILKKRGVDIHTGALVRRIERDGELLCTYEEKGEEHTLPCENVLIATGRRPNTAGLFAPGAEPKMERGAVRVDDDFRTDVEGLYAIGDALGGIQLAHAASAQGIYAVERMAGKEPSVCLSAIPSCVYTDPEIASVGLTADECKERGIAYRCTKYLMSGNGKSMLSLQERGFVKLVFEEGSEVLLGAQLMCARATDMVGELCDALANRLTARQLARTVRPHPTFCEGITEAVEDLWGRSIHTPPKRR